MTDETTQATHDTAGDWALTDSGSATLLPFPVVAIGASAGGLEALEILFRGLPAKPCSAFVVVTHMDPDKKSLLAEVLTKFTTLPVREAEQDMLLEPDAVYVIPPDKVLTIAKGALDLRDREARDRFAHTIDLFLDSLATDQGCNAFCVILSGTGTDGTAGLRAIKEAGGLAIVQDADTAAHPGMPQSAIATRLADFVLPIDEIPPTLVRHLRTACDLSSSLKSRPEDGDEDLLRRLVALLRNESGHDFSTYKLSTLGRRIQKRMLLTNQPTLSGYVELAEEDVRERTALFHDLLIGVTAFFRDKEAFDSLLDHALPSIFQGKEPGDTIRVWVAGCSTGEEAYSIAILLAEYRELTHKKCEVKILATDIDKHAIETARRGVYPPAIAEDLEPVLLEKYFSFNGKDYTASPALRDMIVFAAHDILRDPPFFRLDLIMCRNLFIYLNADAQKKVLSLFYYGLNRAGHLFLGPSETIGSQTTLFSALDKKWRIFKRLDAGAKQLRFPLQPARHFAFDHLPHPGPVRRTGQPNAVSIMDRALAEHYSKASMLVDDEMNAIRIHGDMTRYVEVPQGEVSSNIYKLIRRSLRLQLRTAIKKALETKQQVVVRNLRTGKEEGHAFNLVVAPVDRNDDSSNLLLVLFEDVESVEAGECITEIMSESAMVAQLEDELKLTKDQLQESIDSYDAVSEELKSSNEELMSMNEELQSSFEELETSKEELQSLNEELSIMNAELQMKVEELADANCYLENLFASTNVATIFLDKEMRIQRFTPAASELFPLIDTDVHRPITDIASTLQGLDIAGSARAVLETRQVFGQEVRDSGNRWHLARILPFQTAKGGLEGVVLTLVDITLIKQAQEALRAANEELENRVRERTAQLENAYREADETIQAMRAGEVDAIISSGPQGDQVFTLTGADHVYRLMIEQMSEAAVTMSTDGVILFCNANFSALLHVPVDHVHGALFQDFVSPPDQPLFAGLLGQGLQGKARGEARLKTSEGQDIPVYLSLNVLQADTLPVVAMLITDLGEQKKTEELRASEELFRTLAEVLEVKVSERTQELEQKNKELQDFSFIASHDLQEPLRKVQAFGQRLRDEYAPALGVEGRDFLSRMERAAKRMQTLINDLLEYSRVATRVKPFLPADLGEVAREAIVDLDRLVEETGGSIDIGELPEAAVDRTQMRQVFQNLFENALKYHGGEPPLVTVRGETFTQAGRELVWISVQDNGIGFEEQFLDRIFQPFQRLHGRGTYEGTGIGLAIVRKIVERHKGTVTAHSKPGQGSMFIIELPRTQPEADNGA